MTKDLDSLAIYLFFINKYKVIQMIIYQLKLETGMLISLMDLSFSLIYYKLFLLIIMI